MASSYFKVRRRFDFSPHPFEIGIPLLHRQAYVDNYLFLKLYALDEADYGPFYAYHLHHFLTHQDQPEEVFFEHIWELVEDRIHYLKAQNPFSTQHGAHRTWIRSLQAFQRFLRTVDRWQKRQPLESLLEERNRQIDHLKEEVQALRAELAALKAYEVGEKISVRENNLGTFIDLLQQMQNLTLPDGSRLLRAQTQSPWYKLLSRYFLHGRRDIPINTARNYFPARKDVPLIKGTEVTTEQKRFRIVPIGPQD